MAFDSLSGHENNKNGATIWRKWRCRKNAISVTFPKLKYLIYSILSAAYVGKLRIRRDEYLIHISSPILPCLMRLFLHKMTFNFVAVISAVTVIAGCGRRWDPVNCACARRSNELTSFDDSKSELKSGQRPVRIRQQKTIIAGDLIIMSR